MVLLEQYKILGVLMHFLTIWWEKRRRFICYNTKLTKNKVKRVLLEQHKISKGLNACYQRIDYVLRRPQCLQQLQQFVKIFSTLSLYLHYQQLSIYFYSNSTLYFTLYSI